MSKVSKPESIIKKLISNQTDVLKKSPQNVKMHISNNISNHKIFKISIINNFY